MISCLSMLLFSHSVISESLQPHGLQHTRHPCPSPSPRPCSNSSSLSWWCHSNIRCFFFFFWSLTFLKTWLHSGLLCPSQYPIKLQVIVIIPYRFFWALSLFLFFHCHPFIPLLSAVITYLLWNELCCPKINILKP